MGATIGAIVGGLIVIVEDLQEYNKLQEDRAQKEQKNEDFACFLNYREPRDHVRPRLSFEFRSHVVRVACIACLGAVAGAGSFWLLSQPTRWNKSFKQQRAIKHSAKLLATSDQETLPMSVRDLLDIYNQNHDANSLIEKIQEFLLLH